MTNPSEQQFAPRNMPDQQQQLVRCPVCDGAYDIADHSCIASLKAQRERMSRAVEYALQGFSTDADAPFLAIFRKRYRKAMER